MARASGSISAARGRKKVGESWWMWWVCLYSEEVEGRKCEIREVRREVGGDMIASFTFSQGQLDKDSIY